MGNNYISFFNTTGTTGHTALFSTSKGGETAGSVANNGFSSANVAYIGGETAGSVASSSGSSGSSCSCGGCSFTAIA